MMNVNTCLTDNTTHIMLYCQITMSDVITNVHTCVNVNTNYAMLYVRSTCLI